MLTCAMWPSRLGKAKAFSVPPRPSDHARIVFRAVTIDSNWTGHLVRRFGSGIDRPAVTLIERTIPGAASRALHGGKWVNESLSKRRLGAQLNVGALVHNQLVPVCLAFDVKDDVRRSRCSAEVADLRQLGGEVCLPERLRQPW